MARKRTRSARKSTTTHAPRKTRRRSSASRGIPVTPQPFVTKQLTSSATHGRPVNRLNDEELIRRLRELNIRPTVDRQKLLTAVNRVDPDAAVPVAKLPEEIRETVQTLRPSMRRLHGAKFPSPGFRDPAVFSPCADKFGYMSPASVQERHQAAVQPGDSGAAESTRRPDGAIRAARRVFPDATIPAGFTYVAQFVDHDITFDVSSSLDAATDADDRAQHADPGARPGFAVRPWPGARSVSSMSSRAVGPATAIKFQLGTNRNAGPGGPAGSGRNTRGNAGADRFRRAAHAQSAQPGERIAYGDHRRSPKRREPDRRAVPPGHVAVPQPGCGSAAAGRLHRRHLRRGEATRDAPLSVGRRERFPQARMRHGRRRRRRLGASTHQINSPFRMPVEFAVAAYRFGHSMIRNRYWVNFNFPAATLQSGVRVQPEAEPARVLELGRRLQRVLRDRASPCR